MKILPYTLIILAFLTFGCKKGGDVLPDENLEKYKTTFFVKGFSQTVSPLGKSTAITKDSLASRVKYLYCVIVPKIDLLLNYRIEQISDSAGFGTFNVDLHRGDYQAFFIGTKQPLEVFQYRTFSTRGFAMKSPEPYWEEVFYLDNYELTVAGESQQKEVTLKRFTGAVEVLVQDAIPANAAKIVLENPKEYLRFDLEARSYSGRFLAKQEFILKDSHKGMTNQRFLMHVFYTEHEDYFPLKIKALDNQNNVIAEKTVNVWCAENQKTIVSGKLFTPSSASFNVSVNPVWETPGPTVPF